MKRSVSIRVDPCPYLRKIMASICTLNLLVLAMVLASAGILIGQTNDATLYPTKVRKAPWVFQTNTLPGISFPSEPQAQTAIYTIAFKPEDLEDVPAVCFKGPKTGKIWIGGKMDFYIETKTNIIGGQIDGGVLTWYNSLATVETNVAEAIDKFDKDKNGLPFILSETLPDTDLRHILPRAIFGKNDPMDSFFGKLEVEKIDQSSNWIHLFLKNPITGIKGNAWINLDTRIARKFSARESFLFGTMLAVVSLLVLIYWMLRWRRLQTQPPTIF
jgi:hypothetical protein